MADIKDIDKNNVPRHVAIIMDGNGRWAKKRALNRIRGHEEGVRSVKDIVTISREIGISYLTLYVFSEENWGRPRREIQVLMRLLKRYLKQELNEMLENGIRLNTIGFTEKLPDDVKKILQDVMQKTSLNNDMVLTLALSYGGRQEITNAVQRIAKRVEVGDLKAEEITEDIIKGFLHTGDIPDPDLLIRTSGEFRISNFLLWQIAYTEIYITPTLWPDFRKSEYLDAILEYQRRERRFGLTGDQIKRHES